MEKTPRVKRTKGGTASSRKHHFESFPQRIAKLNIDPVRRVRRPTADDADITTTFSYFKTSFNEWRDLNLSESFTSFAREVAPLCESLPQILHYDNRIMDLLVGYIEKGDTWGLEPLLSLVAHFAHDLGVRFEKHFARVVTTVSQIAAKNQAAEVIEWSFACLAWLFKYLSRLLVLDLRPLFDLIAPLLGKQNQKPFITKFAAEALSFLVRKAGATFHRDKKPLEVIIRHILEDLEESRREGSVEQYEVGLMILFAESVKGIQWGIHSSGQAILQELLTQTFNSSSLVPSTQQPSPAEKVFSGVLITLIHHTDADTFKPLFGVMMEKLQSVELNSSENIRLSARLLFLVSAVRKGSRIEDWMPVLERLNRLINVVNQKGSAISSAIPDVLTAFAVVIQSCPFDVAIPYIRLLETFTGELWEGHFLPFCNFFADLGSERFKSLLLPHFQRLVKLPMPIMTHTETVDRFISLKWDKYGEKLCLVLPEILKLGCILGHSLLFPHGWQYHITRVYEDLANTESHENDDQNLVYACNGFLAVFRTFSMESQLKDSIFSALTRVLDNLLESPDPSPSRPRDLFAAGNVFSYLVHDSQSAKLRGEAWPLLCKISAIYANRLAFWQGLLPFVVEKSQELELEGLHIEPLMSALMACLGSPSHELRLIALEIISIITSTIEDEQNDIIATALLIEQTPLNIQTARSISMHVRKLASSYKTVHSNGWLAKAIPMFCFGLLHVKFSQVWDDSCAALKEICETKEGENIVSQIAFKWLNSSADISYTTPFPQQEETKFTGNITQFECSNIAHISEKASRIQTSFQDTSLQLRTLFNSQHQPTAFFTSSSRAQALRVLNGIPQIAEKHSRLLVPVLLDWVNSTDTRLIQEHKVNNRDQALGSFSIKWARKDQKTMLSLFAQFTNPKVLYKTNEVYSALLSLLGNGDVEIQKSALKAILTWKNAGINRYEENLFNLLDDARFREQISVFLDVGEDDNDLQEEHRDTLMPIILRLLYGKVITRSGSASGRRGQESKRKAVFIALTRFGDGALEQFLRIALGPLDGILAIRNQGLNEDTLQQEFLSPRKQVGLLNMLEDLLETLQTTLAPFATQVVDPLLYCLIRASRSVTRAVGYDTPIETSENVQLSLLKSIRQIGFHSLNMLFESCPELSWASYIPGILQELVEPKLEQLPIETAQSVSGILRLFSAWGKSLKTAPFLVKHNQGILSKVAECLEVPSAKDEVKLFVLNEILRSIIKLTASHDQDAQSTSHKEQQENVRKHILQPCANDFLIHIGNLLRKSPSKDLLEAGVQSIAELAPFVEGSSESRSMIEIATFLLRQPSKRVNPRTKSDLLKILHEFVPRCDRKTQDELFNNIFDVICSLFSFFQDRPSRTVLSDIMKDLSKNHADLQEISDLCEDLNSYSTSRLDEPDFERRSKAFSTVNEDKYLAYSSRQWQPLVFNMLYYIKDAKELSIRTNASFSLRRFIDAANSSSGAGADDFKEIISLAILPGLQSGVREFSELIRVEYLTVLAHLVRSFPSWPVVSDLHVLLAEDDDEASFFTNILHIQQHRRLRALRRLAIEAQLGKLESSNISHIFIPLLEHFIFDKSDDEGAHHLAAETISTIGALTEWLEWPQYRVLLRRFTSYIQSKEDMEKTIIKLLSAIMDSLSRAGQSKGYIMFDLANKKTSYGYTVAGGAEMGIDVPQSKLSRTLPSQEKLSGDLTRNILPPLTAFLHNKDESTVSLRVPMAVAVAKVLRMLPPEEFSTRLSPVLMDVCHILRSKSQDARDMTRKTLADISALIGPAYFGFILKELRSALQRGYQLHVLSFTVHSILISMAATSKPGDLDYCLREIVAVIMDDIFGVTGQEKDAEDYISKMKEVKSSKSFDSMELIAKNTTLGHLTELIRPTKALLLEKLDLKMVKKIDELIRRIGLGILHNEAVKDRDVLVFCYEIIQEVYKAGAEPDRPKEDYRTKRYLINMKDANKSGNRGSSTSHIHKMTRFALDVLRTVLHKHEELQTPQNIAGFVPIVGDALLQDQEEVQMSAIRLLTTIIKVPLPAINENALVYVSEAVRTIKAAASTNSELAQAALKLISAILRERRSAAVKENDLAYLLKRLKPDLEEPDRQGVTFNFLKAVITRKIVIAEVYEVLDSIAAMMVTNHTRTARDLARSVYFQFLMEYPQGKERLGKQLAFLVKNLGYKYVEGRQSVMEALHLILAKVGDNLIQDILNTVFVPLVTVMINDDSSECREMAGALVKRVFERADSEKTKSFISLLRTWLEQDDQPLLKRVALQCWILYFEVTEGKAKEAPFVLEQLDEILSESTERQEDGDWELIYYALQAFSKLCKLSPDKTFVPDRDDLWRAVRFCLSFPHAWVKLSAAKLVGMYFADFASANSENGLGSVPLRGSKGLLLSDEGMVYIASASLRTLRVPSVSEELCTQTVRNLAFLARCFAVNDLRWGRRAVAEHRDHGSGENESEEEDEPEDEQEINGAVPAADSTALHRLLTRLTILLRHEPVNTRSPALYPRTAIITLLLTLCSILPIPSLTPSFHHVLTPLHTLTDPTTTVPHSTDESFNEAYKSLTEKAQEVMSVLQKRMGTTEYVTLLQGVQKGIRDRREGRRAKRRIEAVSMPEKAGQEKRRRHDVKRAKRKEKGLEARGRRRGW